MFAKFLEAYVVRYERWVREGVSNLKIRVRNKPKTAFNIYSMLILLNTMVMPLLAATKSSFKGTLVASVSVLLVHVRQPSISRR